MFHITHHENGKQTRFVKMTIDEFFSIVALVVLFSACGGAVFGYSIAKGLG